MQINYIALCYIVLHYIPMTFKSLLVLLPVSSSNTTDIRGTSKRERGEGEGGIIGNLVCMCVYPL